MVQRHQPRPIGPRLNQRLVPDFGLCPRVGEHQRCAAFFDFINHLRQHGEPQMPAPRKALGAARQQRVDDELFRHRAAHQRALVMAEQRVHGFT